jgi:hypothetical protein
MTHGTSSNSAASGDVSSAAGRPTCNPRTALRRRALLHAVVKAKWDLPHPLPDLYARDVPNLFLAPLVTRRTSPFASLRVMPGGHARRLCLARR